MTCEHSEDRENCWKCVTKLQLNISVDKVRPFLIQALEECESQHSTIISMAKRFEVLTKNKDCTAVQLENLRLKEALKEHEKLQDALKVLLRRGKAPYLGEVQRLENENGDLRNRIYLMENEKFQADQARKLRQIDLVAENAELRKQLEKAGVIR